MKTNNIIVGIIGIMICAIMIGGAFLPAVNSVTKTYDTFDNTKNALYEMNAVDNDSNYTFIWYADTPDIALVNGESVKLASGTILCSIGETSVRFVDGSSKKIQIFGTTDNYAVASTDAGATLTISITGGEYTYSSSGIAADFSVTEPIADGYVIVPKGAGSFVMKAPTQGAYVNQDSEIVGMGVTIIGSSWNVGFSGVGTINGIEITQYSGGTNYTIGPVTINYDAVNNYEDLYTITDYQFDVTNPTDSSVTHITYSYFIVPAKVTADLSNPVDEPIRAMLGVLPIVAIAGLVMAGIYVFISRK